MKIKSLHIIVFFFVNCMVLLSCKKSEEEKVFDKKALLENIGKNIMLTTFQQVSNEAKSLTSLVEAFVKEQNETNLKALQEQWKQTKYAWKKAEVFDFGAVADLFITPKIEFFPTNTKALQEVISGEQIIDQSLITSFGSDHKGLPAIEYILFAEDIDKVIMTFKNNDRLGQLLILLTNELEINIDKIFDLVSKDNHKIVNDYINAIGNGVAGSLSKTTNQMIFLLEKLKMNRVAKPAGFEAGLSLNTKYVESQFAKMSSEFAIKTLEAIELVFSGGEGIGFDDYLDFLNVKGRDGALSEEIKAQIHTCTNAFKNLSVPLQEAMISSSEKVKTIFEELNKLNILLKSDMMSNLSLLVTFSDADGD